MQPFILVPDSIRELHNPDKGVRSCDDPQFSIDQYFSMPVLAGTTAGKRIYFANFSFRTPVFAKSADQPHSKLRGIEGKRLRGKL